MQRLLLTPVLALAIGCAPKKSTTPKDNFDADSKSGVDAKRSGAVLLEPNQAHTDEVNYAGGDKTDWYRVDLKGKPGVLATEIHWDSDASDVMIDVFDEFGAQIAASPVRNKGAKS